MNVSLSIWSMVAIRWHLNTDWPDKQQASLVSHWAGCVIFSQFLNQYWQIWSVWRISAVYYVAAALRDFFFCIWTFRLMVQWEDERTGSAVGEFFITAHISLSFIKHFCSAVEFDSFSGSTVLFLTVISTLFCSVSVGIYIELFWMQQCTATSAHFPFHPAKLSMSCQESAWPKYQASPGEIHNG